MQFIIWLFYAYLIIGLFFGIWFAFRGVQKLDDGMSGAKWNLRLLIVPGSMLLWVYLLKKYLQS